jgi:hypothetical protein
MMKVEEMTKIGVQGNQRKKARVRKKEKRKTTRDEVD